MNTREAAMDLLEQEARALLTRLSRVRSFALLESTVPAAAFSRTAFDAVERYLAQGRRELRQRVQAYLRWLRGPQGRLAGADEAQRRFTFIRLRFNAVLSQFDIFADALSQRSEHDTGIWLSGLDFAATDALALPGYYRPPPLVCYLDRGAGAAIRRARTRLPGGGENPVAVIRVPRERMVGSGIASSLVHEVGHQAAALLDLVASLRAVLKRLSGTADPVTWGYWERCISEILADYWSVSRLGVTSTLGLIGVLSLPRAFVFRINLDDPHPFPWIRVKLSCAMGQALYPHPQWERVARIWESFYPLAALEPDKLDLVGRLQARVTDLVDLLVNHRPSRLRGHCLGEVMDLDGRSPTRLAALWERWRRSPHGLGRAPPTLAFAVLGQARLDGRLNPEQEGELVARLLTHWALRGTLPPARVVAARALGPTSAASP